MVYLPTGVLPLWSWSVGNSIQHRDRVICRLLPRLACRWQRIVNQCNISCYIWYGQIETPKLHNRAALVCFRVFYLRLITHFLPVMNAHLPYQFLCGHLHAVPYMCQKIRMHWIIPATRTNLPWMCTPQSRNKVFLLSGLCCCILHESRKEEYQLKYSLNICYMIIKSWLSVARIFCTGNCMDVLLLATVTTYKIMRT